MARPNTPVMLEGRFDEDGGLELRGTIADDYWFSVKDAANDQIEREYLKVHKAVPLHFEGFWGTSQMERYIPYQKLRNKVKSLSTDVYGAVMNDEKDKLCLHCVLQELRDIEDLVKAL